MAEHTKPWYLRPIARWSIFRSVPLSRLWVLLMAGFLLFSVSGFYADLLDKGAKPYAVVLMIATYTGLNACLWIITISRLPAICVAVVLALQFFNGRIIDAIARWMRTHLHLRPVPSDQGIHFAATSILFATILSYIFFLRYIVREGKQSLRIQSELELAHAIQRTLVPELHLQTPCFEIYGISHPSERVGGDLVDALSLPHGDAIAYLADIAGHGLPASILMGRLKTAARTALLDAPGLDAPQTLPRLLDRLNLVLPQVKEPQMYATFTGFRLGAGGTVFYAMAASPPILHWQAAAQTVSDTQLPQLPLGLLPVPAYDGHTLQTCPGDLLVVATDGILEVCDKSSEEFGIERLKQVIAQNPNLPLPDLARKIHSTACAFGRQFDDQTMLLVRRL